MVSSTEAFCDLSRSTDAAIRAVMRSSAASNCSTSPSRRPCWPDPSSSAMSLASPISRGSPRSRAMPVKSPSARSSSTRASCDSVCWRSSSSELARWRSSLSWRVDTASASSLTSVVLDWYSSTAFSADSSSACSSETRSVSQSVAWRVASNLVSSWSRM